MSEYVAGTITSYSKVRGKGLQYLKRRAARSTAWRGHRMTWTILHSERKSLANGTCTKCGMEVQCNTYPEPNGIDIGGEAVALNCPGIKPCLICESRAEDCGHRARPRVRAHIARALTIPRRDRVRAFGEIPASEMRKFYNRHED